MIVIAIIALSNKKVLVIFYDVLVILRKTYSSQKERRNMSRKKNENAKLIVEANNENLK